MTKKREGHTKKRHKNDNNKYGKKENSDKVEQENQKEKKIPKEHTPFLTTCYRYIKGSCVFLVTLPLKPFKIAYMIMICIWTNFCAFCGRFTKMFSFRRTKSEERMGNQEESADVKTRSESQKNTQKVKVLEQEKRQFSKSTKDSNGKLNLMEEEKETTLKRLTEYEEKLKTMESQKNSSLNRIKEIEAQLNSTDKEKNSALEKVKDIKQKLKTAESDKGDALKKIKEFEANMKSTEKEKTSALQRVKDLEQKLKATESDKEDALKKLREYQSANVYLQTENKNGLERLTEAEKCVRLLTQEKSDALTRLSDIMGTKLRDNNPAITDLNDPNRPMKLGDQFSELYENEWTDAFSDIVDCKNLNLTEIETIAVLLDMLKEVYNICLEDIEEQLSGHKKLVHGFSDDEIEPFLKTAKESVKTNAANYIPLLYRKITSSTSTCKTVVQYKDFSLPYIENCVKICYFAAVQNPPMVIDFEPGQIFDKQSYIEYTRSGTIVEYSVWPVLYLHKGGPILSKGVVQPKDESNSNN
ncbi:thyroid receptor-interacting protein 11-like isoform X9 [Mytilus californianus]|uniref:thyroid receptor-interacting protein 11-like isoform X9 n=1 Tax=Mytilus californianus TaxID=6549 RepID=UPI002247D3DD|nr:thyroid receptor-interacting protein 11-like isoform X9 [Mytilus californianus]